jgi:hypothetical protein
MNNRSMPSAPDLEAALFALAAEKPPGEREPFLRAVCGEDAALRARLDALLAAHDAPAAALDYEPVGFSVHSPGARADEPAEAAGPEAPTIKLNSDGMPDEVIGQKIGRYKSFCRDTRSDPRSLLPVGRADSGH